MRTPKHIAFIAAVALAIPILVSQMLTPTYGSLISVPGVSLGILSALIPGALVWIGTYVGARWAASHQRTVRLARVLGVLYLLAALVLIVPVKTHAVLLDMRSANSGAGPLDFISTPAFAGGVALLMVAASILLTRSVALLCVPRSLRGSRQIE